MRILFTYRSSEWIGVEYLMAIMREKGHDVALFFESGMGEHEYPIPLLNKIAKLTHSREKLLKKAKDFNPDLVCMSILTNMYPWAKEVAGIFKKELGDVPILAGGVHPTQLPEHVLKNTEIDFICRGEGEDCLVNLTNRLEELKSHGSHYKGGDYSDIANLTYMKEGQVVHNPLKDLKAELDELPFPYKQPFFNYGTFTKRLYVMAGRGCPYKCTYCFNPAWQKIYRKKGSWVRYRSVDRVIDELKHFLELYEYEDIFFYDDIFTLNKSG